MNGWEGCGGRGGGGDITDYLEVRNIGSSGVPGSGKGRVVTTVYKTISLASTRPISTQQNNAKVSGHSCLKAVTRSTGVYTH